MVATITTTTNPKGTTMELRELMKLDSTKIAKVQYDALKQHVIDRLMTVVELLKEDRHSEIIDLIEYRTHYDGEGGEHVLNFGYEDCGDADSLDDVIEKLMELSAEYEYEENSILSEKEMWSDVSAEPATAMVCVITTGPFPVYTAASPLSGIKNTTHFNFEVKE